MYEYIVLYRRRINKVQKDKTVINLADLYCLKPMNQVLKTQRLKSICLSCTSLDKQPLPHNQITVDIQQWATQCGGHLINLFNYTTVTLVLQNFTCPAHFPDIPTTGLLQIYTRLSIYLIWAYHHCGHLINLYNYLYNSRRDKWRTIDSVVKHGKVCTRRL